MSSRLFLNIRERLGIAYDVHSFMQKHRDTGYVAVYLGVDPKKAVEAVKAVMGELGRLCDEEVAPDELERAKEFTKGRLRLDLETTNGVAFWLTYQELLLGEIKTIDEELELVDAVSVADIRRIACEILRGPIQMAVIGPFASDARFRSAIGAYGAPLSADGYGRGLEDGFLHIDVSEVIQSPDAEPRATVDSISTDWAEDA